MTEYDVFIAGGGIAGSVAAKFAAKEGLKVLFIEKYKTPRNKSCSGIQFGYFEKILGEKIPLERLCTNKINRVEINFPNGRKLGAPFKIFNFMRDTFDDWLNQVAVGNGAEFRDECELVEWVDEDDGVIITISNEEKNNEKIKAKYLLDATGLRPKIRMKMRPSHFEKQSSGAALNYYIKLKGESDLEANRLYQYWNLDFNNMMFAWIYKKSDLWVVGTGYDVGIAERAKNFFEFVKEKYHVEGEIVKKEGYSSTIEFSGENRVWLGEGRILMVGDAAGLVDLYRGVGMDAAALSGRFAAKAIVKAEKQGKDALELYTKLMKRIVKQTMKNQDKGINRFKTNEELQKYMNLGAIKMGLGMFFYNFVNKFRKAEKQVLLPP